MSTPLDHLWVLTAAILVFIMQAGFMCLESGLTRSKNSINVALKNLADFGISSLCFWIIGFGIMFGESYQGIIGTTYFGLDPQTATLSSFFIFQMVFCSTATTIVSGAVAERMQFAAYLLVALCISTLIYPVVGHWVWNGAEQGKLNGWLAQIGFIDFAGSTVVHSVGGWVSLALILIIGARKGRFNADGKPHTFSGHNLPLAVLGTVILWFGWLGFNGGSTLAFNQHVAHILGNTLMGGAAGMIAAIMFNLILQGKTDILSLINGTLGGLVAITAGALGLSASTAIIVGAIGGIVVILADKLLEKLQIDDAVGAIPVHLAAGIWGTLAVALFADLTLFNSHLTRLEQLGIQALGIVIVGIFSFSTAYFTFLLINLIYPLRIPETAEEEGLNIWEHQANTELQELLNILRQQAVTKDFSLRVKVDPFSEIGQIGLFYNIAMNELEESKINTDNLNNQLQRAQEKLEQKVLERTEELSLANETLKEKIKENQKLFSEIQTYSQELEQKNNRLNEMDRLKDEFLANTSHELRTPLNGVIGLAESLIDGVTGELSPATKNNLAMIVASGKRLSNLVNDILDFSQLKHKKLTLNLIPLDIACLTDLVLTLNQSLTINKPLQLLNNIPRHLSPVLADENRVQQILYNLIGNAIKFTEEGTVTVTAYPSPEQPNFLAISITDTGIGIDSEQQKRIFQPFEQAEGSTARIYGGTGLGLTITKQLVELHGGNLSVTSTLGVGSTFTFTLPCTHEQPIVPKKEISLKTQETTLPATAPDITPLAKIFTQKITTLKKAEFDILAVDDEPINLQVLNNHLTLQNYKVRQARSGEECLALLESGYLPDLIILDVMMPRLTGYQVTQKIRERWQADQLPIVLLTAKNQIADLVQGLELGANDYLTKPVNRDELLARIKTHLRIKHLKVENMRMSAELDITSRLQQMVLPRTHELKNISYLDIAGFMQPADEVGGDYYDVLQYNGRIIFAMGDVTGHGLESGVLMLMVQMAVRTLLAHDVDELRHFLTAINHAVYQNVERMETQKNLSLILIDYDYKTGKLLVTGQHEEMLVIRANGVLERIDTLDLGFPIGLTDDISEYVQQMEVQLQINDLIVLYTDGITEALNPQNEIYGLERLCNVIQQHYQLSAETIRQAIIVDVREFIKNQRVFDDITLLVFRRLK